MLTGIVLFVVARDAFAYCRTTTCDPRVDECQRNDEGCVKTGPAIRWRSLPIPYRFDSVGTEMLEEASAREAIRRAFDTWSNTMCGERRTSLRFKELPDAMGRKKMGSSGGSVPWLIYFRDDGWTHDKNEEDGDESLALTNQLFGKTYGYIDYADIEINTADFKFAVDESEDGVDLEAVITHEVGHYIGLAHSNIEGSVMAPRYHPERRSADFNESHALSEDDERAVCALFPPRAEANEATYPEGSCSASGTKTHGPATDPFLAIGAAIVMVVRRRLARSG